MKRAPWLAVVVVAAVGVVFGRAVTHRFVLYDDDIHIYKNQLVNPPRLENLDRIWREPYLKLYIPVTYSVWLAVAKTAQEEPGKESPRALAGIDPTPFHAMNVGLHALNALLVLFILKMLLAADGPALCGALLFALHPVQTEPVAWVSGAKDLLSSLLALSSIALYVGAALRRRDERSWIWSYLGGAGLCALAILAKPSAIVVPFFAAVMDHTLLGGRPRRVLSRLAPWFLLALAGVLVGRAVQPAESVAGAAQLWQRPLIAADAVAFYLQQLVLPIHMAPFYGRTPERVLASGAAYWTWILPALLFGLALSRWRKSRVPAAALSLFVLGVGPVLGLVPFVFQTFSTTADRYLYLSLLGPALFMGWCLERRPRRTAYIAAAFVLVAFALRSAHQTGYWRSSRALFEHSLRVDEDSDFVHGNLGLILADSGESEAALEHLQAAVRIRPGDTQNQLNLGSFLGQLGRVEEAIGHLQEAVRLEPDYAFAHATLATALAGQGQTGRAIQELRTAVRLDPNFAPAYVQLGTLLQDSGEFLAAEAALREGLRLDGRMNEARVRLGSLYTRLGRLNQALDELREAVAQEPEDVEALAQFGHALVAAGRPEEAVPVLREAVRLRPDASQLQAMLQDAERAIR